MAIVPIKLYELFEEKLGKEEAKKAIKLVEEALDTIEQRAKEQKTILKAELKDELRKELATKEDIAILEQKIEGELKVLRLLIYVVMVMMVVLNKGTIEYIVNLLRAF